MTEEREQWSTDIFGHGVIMGRQKVNHNKNPPELVLLESMVKRAAMDYRAALKKNNAKEIAELNQFWAWLKRPNVLNLDGEVIKNAIEESLRNEYRCKG